MDSSDHVGAEDTESSERTLRLLNFIESDDSLTQRTLAARMDVALGLTNALLKRAVRKGLIKVRTAPARRYAYYLTPKGFQEKSRLTAEYLWSSLSFFRRARQEYGEVFQHCTNRGWRRVVLFGASELAEIAVLAAGDADCQLIAVVDSSTNRTTFAGVPVMRSLEEIDPNSFDAVVITDLSDPQHSYDKLRTIYAEHRCLTPNLLHVSRTNGAPSPHLSR